MILEYKELGKLQEDLFLEIDKLVYCGNSVVEIYKQINLLYKKYKLDIIDDTIPISVNINNKVLHGLESEYCLKKGDVLTIDTCFKRDEKIIDGAKTYYIDETSLKNCRMISVNKELFNTLKPYVRAGVRVSNLLKVISDFIAESGFYFLPNGVGHGIGERLHSKPFLSYIDFTDFNYEFKIGDLFTIEPIITLEKSDLYFNDLGEGFIGKGNVSSQFELTILIDKNGEGIYLNSGLLK